MKRNTRIGAVVGAGVMAALVAWPVYAHCGKCVGSCKGMVKMMEEGKLTLASAVAAAEAHSKGKALVAYAELEEGKLEFDVYCLVGDKIMEVTVDGAGKATEMEEAKSLPAGDVDEDEHEGDGH